MLSSLACEKKPVKLGAFDRFERMTIEERRSFCVFCAQKAGEVLTKVAPGKTAKHIDSTVAALELALVMDSPDVEKLKELALHCVDGLEKSEGEEDVTRLAAMTQFYAVSTFALEGEKALKDAVRCFASTGLLMSKAGAEDARAEIQAEFVRLSE
ncbi:MAG: hypothetical protein AAF517_22235 [Planctomycetota bacterium]